MLHSAISGRRLSLRAGGTLLSRTPPAGGPQGRKRLLDRHDFLPEFVDAGLGAVPGERIQLLLRESQ
jgi:hypothetical protein